MFSVNIWFLGRKKCGCFGGILKRGIFKEWSSCYGNRWSFWHRRHAESNFCFLNATKYVFIQVRAPTEGEVAKLKDGSTLISFIHPGQNKHLLELLTKTDKTVFAMDCVPRISRAQVTSCLLLATYHKVFRFLTRCPQWQTLLVIVRLLKLLTISEGFSQDKLLQLEKFHLQKFWSLEVVSRDWVQSELLAGW